MIAIITLKAFLAPDAVNVQDLTVQTAPQILFVLTVWLSGGFPVVYPISSKITLRENK